MKDKKTYLVRYTETFSDEFEVEADSVEAALAKFYEMADSREIDLSRTEMVDSYAEVLGRFVSVEGTGLHVVVPPSGTDDYDCGDNRTD